MGEQIDRSKIKDPREVSGWGSEEGHQNRQDFSDIAKKSEVNAEFDPKIGHESHQPIAKGLDSAKK